MGDLDRTRANLEVLADALTLPGEGAGDWCLRTLQEHVGGCREELGAPTFEKCWRPAEYVLWGKLIPAEGLGPRCYEHALRYVGHHGLASGANYALIHLGDLARDLEAGKAA